MGRVDGSGGDLHLDAREDRRGRSGLRPAHSPAPDQELDETGAAVASSVVGSGRAQLLVDARGGLRRNRRKEVTDDPARFRHHAEDLAHPIRLPRLVQAPWSLNKAGETDRVGQVLSVMAEACRICLLYTSDAADE